MDGPSTVSVYSLGAIVLEIFHQPQAVSSVKPRKCQNRHCRSPITKPGYCSVCREMWKETVAKAKAAYPQKG
jgi:hypothetical protein